MKSITSSARNAGRTIYLAYFAWVAVFLIKSLAILQGSDAASIDYASVLRSPRDLMQMPVVVVPITAGDFNSIFGMKQPLDPGEVIEIIKQIASCKPAAIAVDLDTSDDRYHTLLKSMPAEPGVPIVWAMRATCKSEEGKEHACTADEKIETGKVLGRKQDPSPPFFSGIADLPNSGVIRSYKRRYLTRDDRGADSFAFAALRQFCGSSKHSNDRACGLAESCFKNGHNCGDPFFILYSASKPSYLTAGNLASLANGKGESNDFQDVIRDKIVFLGGEFPDSRDSYATPSGVKYGVEIHLEAFAAQLNNDIVEVRSRWLVAFAETLCLVLLMWIVRLSGSCKLAVASRVWIVMLALTCLSFLLSWFTFQRFEFALNFVPMLGGIFLDLLGNLSEESIRNLGKTTG
jgi:CHASE2 domain-containing sensor protein